MEKEQKEVLQVTKEIMVKFIESSRVSPNNFAEVFPAVYDVIRNTVGNDAHGRAICATVKGQSEEEKD